jgi:four helix bundle protein
MGVKGDNLILKLTLDFAIDVVEYTEVLEETKKYVIARQLLKSGTSIGANVREAQNAESLSDFVHKMKIAAKELEETDYWLFLCKASKRYPDCSHLTAQLENIANILNKIIITCKAKT